MPDITPEKARAMLDLLESMEVLSKDWEAEELDEIAAEAKADPMPIERARPFYARILKVLHPERTDEAIAAEVEEILARQARSDV